MGQFFIDFHKKLRYICNAILPIPNMKPTKEVKKAFKQRLEAIDKYIPTCYCTLIKDKFPQLSKNLIYRVRNTAVANELIMQELEALAHKNKERENAQELN